VNAKGFDYLPERAIAQLEDRAERGDAEARRKLLDYYDSEIRRLINRREQVERGLPLNPPPARITVRRTER
jgi:hypothetical protein